jgi:hypothetical protein
MHLRSDMCSCQEERDARQAAETMEEVAATMEELLSDLQALITLDYLYAIAQVIIHGVTRVQFRVQCFRVQCCTPPAVLHPALPSRRARRRRLTLLGL